MDLVAIVVAETIGSTGADASGEISGPGPGSPHIVDQGEPSRPAPTPQALHPKVTLRRWLGAYEITALVRERYFPAERELTVLREQARKGGTGPEISEMRSHDSGCRIRSAS